MNYAERKSRPHFRILEALCFYKLGREKELRFFELAAQKEMTAQGYPGFGLQLEAVNNLRSRAHQQVADFAQRLYPWADLEQGEDAAKAALRQEAPALIAEWYRYFDPDNLENYLHKLREREKARIDAQRN